MPAYGIVCLYENFPVLPSTTTLTSPFSKPPTTLQQAHGLLVAWPITNSDILVSARRTSPATDPRLTAESFLASPLQKERIRH